MITSRMLQNLSAVKQETENIIGIILCEQFYKT